MDRELIYPSPLEEYVPASGLMNQGWVSINIVEFMQHLIVSSLAISMDQISLSHLFTLSAFSSIFTATI